LNLTLPKYDRKIILRSFKENLTGTFLTMKARRLNILIKIGTKLNILCASCNYYLDRCLIRTSIHPTLKNDYKIILRNFSVLSTQTAAPLLRKFDRVTFLTMKAKSLKFLIKIGASYDYYLDRCAIDEAVFLVACDHSMNEL
jgi:hypothetical protein